MTTYIDSYRFGGDLAYHTTQVMYDTFYNATTQALEYTHSPDVGSYNWQSEYGNPTYNYVCTSSSYCGIKGTASTYAVAYYDILTGGGSLTYNLQGYAWSADTIYMIFNYQDSNNYWYVYCDNTSSFYLGLVLGGTNYQIDTFVWNESSFDKLTVVARGDDVQVFTDDVAVKAPYSEVNRDFKTETAVGWDRWATTPQFDWAQVLV